MPRLIDHLRLETPKWTLQNATGRGLRPNPETWQSTTDHFLDVLNNRAAPIITVDQAARTFIDTKTRNLDWMDPKDMPKAKSPFSQSLFEYRLSDELGRKFVEESPLQGLGRIRGVVAALTAEPYSKEEWPTITPASSEPIVEIQCWSVVPQFDNHHFSVGPVMLVALTVLKSGQHEGMMPILTPHPHYSREASHNEAMRVSILMLSPIIFAISMMHCRNVQLVERMPPSSAEAEWQRGKRKKRPLTRYHILDIDPREGVATCHARLPGPLQGLQRERSVRSTQRAVLV